MRDFLCLLEWILWPFWVGEIVRVAGGDFCLVFPRLHMSRKTVSCWGVCDWPMGRTGHSPRFRLPSSDFPIPTYRLVCILSLQTYWAELRYNLGVCWFVSLLLPSKTLYSIIPLLDLWNLACKLLILLYQRVHYDLSYVLWLLLKVSWPDLVVFFQPCNYSFVQAYFCPKLIIVTFLSNCVMINIFVAVVWHENLDSFVWF